MEGRPFLNWQYLSHFSTTRAPTITHSQFSGVQIIIKNFIFIIWMNLKDNNIDENLTSPFLSASVSLISLLMGILTGTLALKKRGLRLWPRWIFKGFFVVQFYTKSWSYNNWINLVKKVQFSHYAKKKINFAKRINCQV